MKPTAVIIDDEEDARGMVGLFLEKDFPNISVVGNAGMVSEAKVLILDQKPDIIFLDVEMPDGTGFDLLTQLGECKAIIIFITAFDQYAIEAIKASALDYILKPINRSEFSQAVNKALEKWRERQAISSKKAVEVGRIALPDLNGLKFVDIDKIAYCEAENNYTTVHMEDGFSGVVSRSLSYFDRLLTPHGFLRIHHKHLVNLKMIQSYVKGKGGGYVMMPNNCRLPVSARKKSDLMRSFAFQE